MIKSIYIIADIAIAAGAGICSKALIGTGGCSHFLAVGMVACRNVLGFKVIAISAITSLLAVLGAGSRVCYGPFTHIMSGSTYALGLIVIAIITVTSVKTVAFASGKSHALPLAHIVTGSGDLLCFKMIASIAIASLLTVNKAGCRLGYTPLAKAMAGGVNVIRRICISAITGINRIAFSQAGGLCYGCFVGMSLCIYGILLFKHLSADRAMRSLGKAGFGTGGSLRFICNRIVTQGISLRFLTKCTFFGRCTCRFDPIMLTAITAVRLTARHGKDHTDKHQERKKYNYNSLRVHGKPPK